MGSGEAASRFYRMGVHVPSFWCSRDVEESGESSGRLDCLLGPIDDPLVALPPSTCDYDGFSFDTSIECLLFMSASGPQLTVFYGFADTATEAGTLLNTAGATTRALAHATDGESQLLTTLFGVHRNS